MKVRVLHNQKEVLPQDLREKYPESLDSVALTIDKDYTVYSLATFNGLGWYCICDEHFTYWPRYRQSFWFHIVDHKVSRYWLVNQEIEKSSVDIVLAFKEWASEEYFYGNLVDGEERERKIFKAYKELMDLEFADDSIKVTAQIGDEEWLICPSCLDGWQSKNSLDALVRCANCKTVSNNPRYYELRESF